MTAGDYCRRFDWIRIDWLMDAFNETRVHVWKAQPESFRDRAIIDADGVMVETYGRFKQECRFVVLWKELAASEGQVPLAWSVKVSCSLMLPGPGEWKKR